MNIEIINWVLQLIAAGFSAVVGAAVLLMLQTVHRRGRFLRAIQSELELNQNRLEGQIHRLESEAEDSQQQQFPGYHTEVYDAIKVNDPTLFLNLHSKILRFENVYETFNQLDDLSNPGIITTTPPEQLIEQLSSLSERVEESIEAIEEIRENNFVYRNVGGEGATLRKELIVLGEKENERDE